MNDKDKTKEQLIEELDILRDRIVEMEGANKYSKRQMDGLSASEIRYRRLFETAKDGILILDVNTGQIDDVNPFLIDLLGYSKEEFLGKKLWEIGSFKDNEASNISFKELQNKEYIRYENLPLETKEGRKIDVEFVSNVYPVNGKNVVQCNIRNITDRKRIEKMLMLKSKELERSNKELESFAAATSHDLKEPLRSLATYLQLLVKRYGDKLDSEASRLIKESLKAAERMYILIDDLLAYSQAIKKDRVLTSVNCLKVLEQTILNLKVAIEENNVSVTFDSLPALEYVEHELMQVFQNLLGNAVKYRSKDAPKVHISAKQSGKEWIFSIQDNGIGIEPQYFERIFEIFQRLHSRDEYSGTGIGLAICKKIVEKHDGRIWVESRPGEGSTFYFTIPNEKNQ